jgi:hypothetical protein
MHSIHYEHRQVLPFCLISSKRIFSAIVMGTGLLTSQNLITADCGSEKLAAIVRKVINSRLLKDKERKGESNKSH